MGLLVSTRRMALSLPSCRGSSEARVKARSVERSLHRRTVLILELLHREFSHLRDELCTVYSQAVQKDY